MTRRTLINALTLAVGIPASLFLVLGAAVGWPQAARQIVSALQWAAALVGWK